MSTQGLVAERELIRRHCTADPRELVSLPGRQLLELFEELDDERRQASALREHLRRRHGCDNGCHGVAS